MIIKCNCTKLVVKQTEIKFLNNIETVILAKVSFRPILFYVTIGKSPTQFVHVKSSHLKKIGDGFRNVLNPSPILVPRPTAKVFPALARTTKAHNNFTNPPLVNIFLTTPNVPSITATKNFLFSLVVALPFTFLLLKRLSLNLSIPFCVSKKNSYTL